MFLNFVLLSGLYLSLLCLAFVMASYKNYNFSLQRVLILLSLGIGICLPLLSLPLLNLGEGFQGVIYAFTLPAIEINGGGQATQSVVAENSLWPNVRYLLQVLVAGGMLLFALRYFYGLSRLSLIIRKGKKRKIGIYNIVQSDEIKVPCSFGKYILLPLSLDLDDPGFRFFKPCIGGCLFTIFYNKD